MPKEYKVDWVEKKTTSTGKEKFDVSITTPEGSKLTKVTMWAEEWGNVTPGSVITATLYSKQNGEYLNHTLYKPKETKPRAGNPGIKAAQERKAENIKESQDRKEIAIELSSSFRDATLITLEQFKNENFNEDDFKQKWLEWRNWLRSQFGDASDHTNKAPF